MSNFYSERQVKKTHKDHKCLGCNGKISKGSAASYIAGIGEDGFDSYYLCIPCREWSDHNPGQDGDEWREGDVGDARRQEEEKA